MVSRRHNAFVFHLLHKTRGLVVANRQFALDVGGRAFAILYHNRNRLVVERIFAIGIAAKPQNSIDVRCTVFRRTFDDAANVFRRSIGLEMVYDLFNLLIFKRSTNLLRKQEKSSFFRKIHCLGVLRPIFPRLLVKIASNFWMLRWFALLHRKCPFHLQKTSKPSIFLIKDLNLH